MTDLNKTICFIQTTMKVAKSKVINKTVIRRMNHPAAVIPNANRWSGKCQMVNRFVRVRQKLIAVTNDKRCDLPMDAIDMFAEKAFKYGKMLKEINSSKECYRRGLSVCRSVVLSSMNFVTSFNFLQVSQMHLFMAASSVKNSLAPTRMRSPTPF